MFLYQDSDNFFGTHILGILLWDTEQQLQILTCEIQQGKVTLRNKV